MFGCDANGIDEKPATLKAEKLEASVSCGQDATAHLRAVDAKGNAITFDLVGPAHDGQAFTLSLQKDASSASEQVAQSSDATARVSLRSAAGADAVDSTTIISAFVEVKSLPDGDKPFTIQVRLGFEDGATLNEEYRVLATPDATCNDAR